MSNKTFLVLMCGFAIAIMGIAGFVFGNHLILGNYGVATVGLLCGMTAWKILTFAQKELRKTLDKQ